MDDDDKLTLTFIANYTDSTRANITHTIVLSQDCTHLQITEQYINFLEGLGYCLRDSYKEYLRSGGDLG